MAKPRMHAEDRKLAIVRAALPLFARHGFAKTTTKDLARAAGVSEPLLYKHFPSKEALYREIQDFTCRDIDPLVQKLNALDPSTSTLVHLVFYLMRALVAGKPTGSIKWDTRHRLMTQSFLADGVFARLIYENRFDCFCSRIEACLEAAVAAGDAVESPVSKANLARFAHHVGAWIALVHLPERPSMNYKVKAGELLQQAVWFVLRGMGLKDQAIARHYNPKAIELFFNEP
jgi:AcrR family transcriptional regulator